MNAGAASLSAAFVRDGFVFPIDAVTAWVALSPATRESGCMRFVAGSHLREIVEHRDTFSAKNMLSRGQEIAVAVDDSEAVDVLLEPGQMSLHHGRTFHASHANRSSDRRIGLAIRYIAPSMKQTGERRTVAVLVRGEDRYGHFELAPPPSGIHAPSGLGVTPAISTRRVDSRITTRM